MATPSALSAIWFAPSERTVATAIGSLSNNFGPTLAFLLALPVVNSSGMEWLLFSEAVVALFTFISIFFFFPSLPKTPPSAAAEQRLQDEERSLLQFSLKEEKEEGELLINHTRKRSLGEKDHPVNSKNSQTRQVMIQYLWDMWALLKDSSLMLLVFSSGVASGVFNVWSGSIGVILQGVIR
jgi:hypothetical protein